VTRSELLAAFAACDLNEAAFCARTGYSPSTTRCWGHERHPVPRLVGPLLLAWGELALARAAVLDAELDVERLRDALARRGIAA
jgi:hypothetical protein